MAASTLLSTTRSIPGKKAGSKNTGKSADSKRPTQPPIKCPECASQRIWKDGLRYVKSETATIPLQRFLCRSCGRRFSENNCAPPNPRMGPNPTSHTDVNLFGTYLQHIQTGYKASSKLSSSTAGRDHRSGGREAASFPRIRLRKGVTGAQVERKVGPRKGQVCTLSQKTRMEKAAGAIKLSREDVAGKIVEYMWRLKRNGYAESTIVTYTSTLKVLVRRGADLYNPESVKYVIAVQESWSRGRKRNAVKAYNLFTKMEGITWEKPKYKPIEKLPFIPTEREIDELVAGCGKQMATYLQMLKETGARRGEVFNVKWIDIDFVADTVRITPEKGSKARIFKISDKLKTMLHNLPKNSERVWSYKNVFYVDKGFRRMRKRIAHKLGNPRILQIHFHTLRHWKATIEYARTKDILYVKQLLGHRSINTTLKYIQLVSLPQEEKFICKVAKSSDSAAELIEAGFEYVTGEYGDGGKLFRKRKLTYLGSVSIPVGSWSSLV